MSTTSSVEATTGQSPALPSETRFKICDISVKVLTLIAVVGGAVFGFYKFYEERDREYRLALYRERKEMYYPLCRAAAEIANSTSLREAQPKIQSFQSLYYGGVRIVSDEEFTSKVDEFLEALLDFKSAAEDDAPPLFLIQRLNDLEGSAKRALALDRVFNVLKDGKQQAETETRR